MKKSRFIEAQIMGVLRLAKGRMIPFPVGGDAVDEAGQRSAGPRPLIRDIGPAPALLDAFTQTAVAGDRSRTRVNILILSPKAFPD